MKDAIVGRLFVESGPIENAMRNIEQIGPSKARLITVLQEANKPNRNGRVYERKVIEKALQSSFIKEKIATNSWAGELNHPPNPTMQRQLSIDMSNISHFIKRYWWDAKDPNLLMGEVVTAGTTVGRDFAGMIIEDGMQCSFSMRGGGDVYRKGGMDYVKDPLKLIGYDAVHFPSHAKAYALAKLGEDMTVDVTGQMLAEYISQQSENFAVLSESLQCFTQDALSLEINDGKIMISEKASGKQLGFALMEAKLVGEYNDTIRSRLIL